MIFFLHYRRIFFNQLTKSRRKKASQTLSDMDRSFVDKEYGEQTANMESIAWHWYDLTCPFCYVGKSRNIILKVNGYHLVQLPFQAHPDISAEGLDMGPGKGPMYEMLEKEAKGSGLTLNWPARLPNSRYALAMAEQVRRHFPVLFPAVKDRLYAAHFVLGEDLGSEDVVHNCLGEFGVGKEVVEKWLEDGLVFHDLAVSQQVAENIGVNGTPAWVIDRQLISGLQPRAYFQQFSARS